MAKNKSAKELKKEIRDLSGKLVKFTKQRTKQTESAEKALNKLSDKIHNIEVDINRKTAKLAEAEARETKAKEKNKNKPKPVKPAVVPAPAPVAMTTPPVVVPNNEPIQTTTSKANKNTKKDKPTAVVPPVVPAPNAQSDKKPRKK